jgi:hypothetical protein
VGSPKIFVTFNPANRSIRMKMIYLVAFMISFVSGTIAQPTANYDKTLNEAEVNYLNTLFKDTVQFDHKMVGFVYQDYQPFITDKHHFFSTATLQQPMIYRLMHLNASEKKQSGGYDVLVIYQTNEGKKPKANKPDRTLVVDATGRRQYYHTHDLAARYYPDNLSQLGVDSSVTLTPAESEYLNAVFQWEHKDIDFTNKKVAFFSGLAGDKLVTKMDYFNYRKHALSNGWYQGQGTLVVLNERQQQESGVDCVIVYMSKLYNLDKMMAALKNN